MELPNTIASIVIWLAFIGPSGEVSSSSVNLHPIETKTQLGDLMSTYTNLFLFYCADSSSSSEASCEGAEALLGSVARVVAEYRENPVRGFGFGVARADSRSELAEWHGLTQGHFPAMIYVRKNVDGDTHGLRFTGELNDTDADETFVTMWMRENSRSFLQTLGDEEFEHLTQAASGATTGDWLVWFGPEDDWAKGGPLRVALDTIAAEFKYQLSVAVVKTNQSPKLIQRFSLPPSTSTVIRYFRLEKMYRYESQAPATYEALRAFVKGGFRHATAERVPPEPTPWDTFLESVVERVRGIGYPNVVGPLLLTLAIAAATSILVVLACCSSRGKKEHDTKFKKG